MIQVAAGVGTLPDILRWRSEHQSDERAFSFVSDGDSGQVAITYAELDSRARGVAVALQACGARGDRALLIYPPGLDFVVALFGCLYAGWIAVPAAMPTTSERRSRLHAIARDALPTVGLTGSAVRARVEQELTALRWLATDELQSSSGEDWRDAHLALDHPAILQYTSGSTESPRGVVLSHGNLAHNTRQIARRFEIDPSSRGVIWLPPFHDMGLIGGILQGIQGGFPITLMSPMAFVRRPARWLETISRERATISGGPNFAYDLCVERVTPRERTGLDLSCWEVAFNGAEPVRAETLERFADAFAGSGFRREAFYPCYGLAEATLMVSGGKKSAAPTVLTLDDGARLVSCGAVIDEHDLRIVEPASCVEVSPGQVGEAWVRGPSVAQGYWGQLTLTMHTFSGHLAGAGEGPFLRTGDLGFLHDGELYVTGRSKSLLVVAGRNLHAEDIENTVARSHQQGWPGGVAAVSVDDDGRERLVVLQEVSTRSEADLDHIVHAIRLRVAEQHQVPVSTIVLLRPGALPRTSSGKPRRHACRDAVLEGAVDVLREWRLGSRQ